MPPQVPVLSPFLCLLTATINPTDAMLRSLGGTVSSMGLTLSLVIKRSPTDLRGVRTSAA